MSLLSLDREAREAALIWWRRVGLTPEVRRGVAEGKMFGLLLCRAPEGLGDSRVGVSLVDALPRGVSWVDPSRSLVSLVAFSGQLDGVWERPGWAPSLLNHHRVAGESWRAQRDLHRFSRDLKRARRRGDVERVRELKRARRDRSNEHAALLRDHTRVTCVSGEAHALSALWPDAATGVGECCAPKLLCWSAQLELEPLGLAEFCVLERRDKPPRAELIDQREVRFEEPPIPSLSERLSFYSPCEERCGPLIPLILS